MESHTHCVHSQLINELNHNEFEIVKSEFYKLLHKVTFQLLKSYNIYNKKM